MTNSTDIWIKSSSSSLKENILKENKQFEEYLTPP
jgi:hypothetical protein